MNEKQTRAWLESYCKLKKELKAIQKELDELKTGYDMMQLRSPSLSGMPHSGRISDPTASAVLKYESTLERYTEKAARLLQRMNEIEDAVERLPVDQRLILRLYYLAGVKNWRKVGEIAGFSESYCWALAKRGVTALSAKVNRP